MPQGKQSKTKRKVVRDVLNKRTGQDAQLPRDPNNPTDTVETIGGVRPAGWQPDPPGTKKPRGK